MAIGTHLLIFKVEFTTLGTSDDFSGYCYTTIRTKRSLVAYLPPTFGAFDYCHNVMKCLYEFIYS